MHKLISVAVPTRNRPAILHEFFKSFVATTPKNENTPVLTILHDSPPLGYFDGAVCFGDKYQNDNFEVRSIVVPDKSGLTRLFNLSIVFAPTDWVLICNDDITFNPGWLQYLEEKIAEGKWNAICLFNFGAICIHKSMMLKVGWFDERFDFGGHEDNDYQLRIAEAGLKDTIERSHDFIRRDGDVEVGHYVNHNKYVHKGSASWHGDNSVWATQKWGHINYAHPCRRVYDEVDWYPKYSMQYARKFNMLPEWPLITSRSMQAGQFIKQ
jgi:glycosyltransferase involved in cell wall biosynthesis